MKTWTCGDCHTTYPRTVRECPRELDDHLAVNGGSIKAAISLAVARRIGPLVKAAEERLRPRRVWLINGKEMKPVRLVADNRFPLAG